MRYFGITHEVEEIPILRLHIMNKTQVHGTSDPIACFFFFLLTHSASNKARALSSMQYPLSVGHGEDGVLDNACQVG